MIALVPRRRAQTENNAECDSDNLDEHVAQFNASEAQIQEPIPKMVRFFAARCGFPRLERRCSEAAV